MLLLLIPAFAIDDIEIQDHLLEVVDTLRAETSPTLRPQRRARRLAALSALESYAWAGDYPSAGTGQASPRRIQPPRVFQSQDPAWRVPRFVDDQGTHCAVGYLVALDAPELVATLQREHEFDWIGAMTEPALDEWANAHGFTREELAWIQPSYREPIPRCGELPDLASLDLGSPEECGLASAEERAYVCADKCNQFEVWVPVHWDGAEEATIDVLLLSDSEVDQRSQVTLQSGAAAWVGPMTVSREDYRDASVVLETATCDASLGVSAFGSQSNLKVDACAVTCSQVPGGMGVGGILVGLGMVATRRRRLMPVE